MADKTSIEWTDATWNPITGCSVTSPGCTNCYAMQLAGTRLAHHPSRAGLTHEVNGNHVWTGETRFNEQWLDQPLRWRKPRMIFVCAHGDLFHESVPDEWIDRVFAVMALAPHHVFQVLTKRAARMREWIASRPVDTVYENMRVLTHPISRGPNPFSIRADWPLPNVWLGVSVEDQARADERIPDLLATPAAVRWLSCEPLLGPVDLTCIRFQNARGGQEDWDALDLHLVEGEAPDGAVLDWIVVGGESGGKARPMHPDWARSLRDQCAAAGVPFLFKQWGEWGRIADQMPAPDHLAEDADRLTCVGKKRAGRLLDGVQHNGFPA